MFDRDVVSRGVTKRILWHSRPVTADIRAPQVQNADVESFDAANLALDVGYANGTGRTTGASLTPGLGGSGAFYVSLRVSR